MPPTTGFDVRALEDSVGVAPASIALISNPRCSALPGGGDIPLPGDGDALTSILLISDARCPGPADGGEAPALDNCAAATAADVCFLVGGCAAEESFIFS